MTARSHLFNGVAVATVASEPDELGRVELRFDWMEGDSRSFRAPIATLASGSERGTWFMPEEGDEVLVAFGHGRFDHPFVIGFLWNGRSRPPNDGIDRRVRRIRTPSGHQLDFDDRDGNTKITIETAGGHSVRLDDASRSIRIESSAGVSIELDAAGSVTIDAPQGVEVNTPRAVFSGQVEAQVVSATLGRFTTVDGTAYLPARGTVYP